MPEAGNHRVDVFDLNGKFLFDFGGLGTEPGKMNNPESAKFNSEGKLYVADLKNDRIQVFDKDGKLLKLWGKTGSATGEFKSPAGIAIDAQDRVYVTEIGNDRVQVFDKDGQFLTTLAARVPATASSATCMALSSTRPLAGSTSPTPPTIVSRCSSPRRLPTPDPPIGLPGRFCPGK